MKVLLTGMTLNHIGRHKGHRFWDCDLIEAALLAAGHEVDRRAVACGEDLTGYDLAFIAMQKMNSITTFEHRHGAIYAASVLPHVLVFEDFAKNFRAPINALKPRYIWDYPTGGMMTPKLDEIRRRARRFQQQLDNQIDFWASSDARAIIVGYRWGRTRIGKPLPNDVGGPVVQIPQTVRKLDVTSFYPAKHGDFDRMVKARRWAFATLLRPEAWRYDPRARATWPILNIGNPADDGAPERKQVEFTELIRRWYVPSWGVMSWPYKFEISGCGIWRDRYHHAIAAGCVALFSPAEVADLGAPYQVPLAQIESMTEHELELLADAQRDCFTAKQATPLQAIDALQDVMDNFTNKGVTL